MKHGSNGWMAWMQQIFPSLQPREIRLIAVMTLLIFILIGYQLAWVPSWQWRAREEEDFRAHREARDWMQAHAGDVRSGPETGSAGLPPQDASQLLQLATDTAQASHITLSHADPAEGTGLRVTIDSIALPQLLAWLDALRHDHQVRAVHVTLDRTADNSGAVSASLLLQAP